MMNAHLRFVRVGRLKSPMFSSSHCEIGFALVKECLLRGFQVGVLLNDGNPNRTRQHMKEIIHLETLIAQITVSSAERRDEEKLYHALTIADLATLAPFVSTHRLHLRSFYCYSSSSDYPSPNISLRNSTPAWFIFEIFQSKISWKQKYNKKYNSNCPITFDHGYGSIRLETKSRRIFQPKLMVKYDRT